MASLFPWGKKKERERKASGSDDFDNDERRSLSGQKPSLPTVMAEERHRGSFLPSTTASMPDDEYADPFDAKRRVQVASMQDNSNYALPFNSRDSSSAKSYPEPEDDYQDPFDSRGPRQRPLNGVSPTSQMSQPPPGQQVEGDDYSNPADCLSQAVGHKYGPRGDTYAVSSRRLNEDLPRSLSAGSRSPMASLSSRSSVPPPLPMGVLTVDTTLILERQPWFHGHITRDRAEILLQNKTDSSFLVRNSESCRTDYSLSVRNSGQSLHLKIHQQPDKRYVLGQNSKPFDRIPDMISFYTQHKLNIKGAEHICLEIPIMRLA